MKTKLLILGLVALLLSSAIASFQFSLASADNLKVIERPVLYVVQKIIVIYEPRPLEHFQSERQLREWVTVNLVPDMGDQRCVAEALEMQRRAYRDGYLMGTQSLFFGRTEPDNQEWEEVAKAWVGRRLFFIQPVTGQVWPAGHSIKGIE